MPGVNLDLAPALSEELNSSDCAQSGLEEVIGDLLAQDVPADKEEHFVERKFEFLLRCAVEEIHMDLKAFGKQVDKRLEEAAAQVAPLAQNLARLHEENKCLRGEQEKLVREVETLCQAMGIKDPLLQTMLNLEVTSQSTVSNPPFSDMSSFSQGPIYTYLDNGSTQVTESPLSVPKESILYQQDLKSASNEASSPLNSSKQSTMYQHDLYPSSKEVNSGFNTSVCVPQDFASKEFSSTSPVKSPPKEANSPLKSPKSVPQESILYPKDFDLICKEGNSVFITTKGEPQEFILYPEDLKLPSKETKDLFHLPLGVPQESKVYPQDFESSSKEANCPLNSPKGVPQESQLCPQDFDFALKDENSASNTKIGVPHESIFYPQDFESPSKDSNNPLNSPINASDKSRMDFQDPNLNETTRPKLAESSPAPHSPAFFSTRRSLSAPSLMGNVSCSTMEMEPIVASEPVFSAGSSVQVGCPAPTIHNGPTSQTKPEERSGKLTTEQLFAIEDEDLLEKMLDQSKDFEERKLIRAAMRDLRKRKREAMLGCSQEEMDLREKERESRLQELRQQKDDRSQKPRAGGTGEVVMRKVEKSADGSTLSQVTKTNRFAQSDDGSRSTRSTVVEASYVQKTDRGTVQSKSYSYSSSTSSSTSLSSNTGKKVGSVFDREDDTASPRGGGGGGGGGLAAVERRQAERRKELMRAQTMPKSSSMQARKAMIERLEKDGGGSSGSPAVAKINRVQRSTSFGVPNANSIKQMLLDWCRAKTRSYEHVDIQNFSSSWSNGMAFCALVHYFFPEAFDYSSLSPSNRRHNFEVAFSTAEKMVDCPQLLDVDDMVKMREPDWKCVYTYLQEFYRGLVTKGLVKTRNNN